MSRKVVAVTHDVKRFKNIMDTVAGMTSQATLVFSPEQVYVEEMDTSNVAVVQVKLLSGMFAEYKCAETTRVRISMEQALFALKHVSTANTIQMTHAVGSNKMELRFYSKEDGTDCKFMLGLLTETEVVDSNIPEFDFGGTCTLPCAAFRNTINALFAAHSAATIQITPEHVRFTTADDEKMEVDITHALCDVAGHEVKTAVVDGPVKVRVATRYLSLFSKATASTEYMSLMFGRDTPLCVFFPLRDMADEDCSKQEKQGQTLVEQGSITFFLAPKTDEDEDSDEELDGQTKRGREEDDEDDDESLQKRSRPSSPTGSLKLEDE